MSQITISLNYDSLYEVVSRSLSIVGKRIRDDKGTPEYEDVTLGSREKEIIMDYLRQAVIDLSAELSAFIVGGTDTGITFFLDMPDNYKESLGPFVHESCEAYCVSYALYSWFFIAVPRIAPRYLDDCKRQLAAVIRLIHEKKAPEAATSSPLDVVAEVE